MEYEASGPLDLVAVSPTALRSASDEVEQIAAAYAAGRAALIDELAAAEAAFGGWWLGRVFGQLNTAWSQDFRTFDQNLAAVADRLDEAAAAYQAGDQVSSTFFWYLR